jgi:putative oxidoreductase
MKISMLKYLIGQNSDDVGKLILRVSVAVFILVHGVSKIMMPAQVDFIMEMFTAVGLPGVIAYGVYIGEVAAPIAMIVGWRTKIAAFLVAGTMTMVILVGHTSEIFPLSSFSWWGIELQTSFLLGAIAVFFLGAGRYAFSSQHRLD